MIIILDACGILRHSLVACSSNQLISVERFSFIHSGNDRNVGRSKFADSVDILDGDDDIIRMIPIY